MLFNCETEILGRIMHTAVSMCAWVIMWTRRRRLQRKSKSKLAYRKLYRVFCERGGHRPKCRPGFVFHRKRRVRYTPVGWCGFSHLNWLGRRSWWMCSWQNFDIQRRSRDRGGSNFRSEGGRRLDSQMHSRKRHRRSCEMELEVDMRKKPIESRSGCASF
jgi:hypothetical protein